MALLPWIAARIVGALATTIAVSAVSFVLIRLLYPEAFGDPRSLIVQVAEFLERMVLHLDLGTSRVQDIAITDLLVDRVPVDVALFTGALAIGVGAGLVGGVLCSRKPNGVLDRALSGLALLTLSVPVYWVGLVVIMWFGKGTGSIGEVGFIRSNAYVPPGEDLLGWLQAMALPWCITGAPLAAFCLRLCRSAMIDTRGEDYVRTAIAKGLRARRVDFRHAMPPAVPTTVALAGAYAPVLVGNALLVEIVFNLPGVFRGFPDALDTNDFVLIQALIVVGALMVALANLAADLVLAGLDPRTRPWAARS
jgi:peptide/nickel transport system permease protein